MHMYGRRRRIRAVLEPWLISLPLSLRIQLKPKQRARDPTALPVRDLPDWQPRMRGLVRTQAGRTKISAHGQHTRTPAA